MTKSKSGGKRRAEKDERSGRNNLLVRDFLVPRLDSRFYGDELKWLNRSRGTFLINWTHQSSKSFDREGPNIFRVSLSSCVFRNAYISGPLKYGAPSVLLTKLCATRFFKDIFRA